MRYLPQARKVSGHVFVCLSSGVHFASFLRFCYWILELFQQCGIVIPPLHRRGVYCFTSVRPSFRPSVRPSVLPSVLPSVRPSVSPSFRPSKIFFVTFFSATIDGRNLIFGHKLHISMPYCGKRFWTRQIPTSCLPT
jgi:hypothetical protein